QPSPVRAYDFPVVRKAEPELEKKPRHWPQREPVVPGIVDLELIQEVPRSPKPDPSGTYRFGRLSHHSFFTRNHPHPHQVTHMQDLTGKPICIVRNKFSPLPHSSFLSHCLMVMPTISVPIGDPQFNRNPRLSYEAWKKELKELASRVAMFTKETEQKDKEKEEPPREQGARYSAETGRLIPASTQALSRRSSHQGQRSHLSSRDRGVQPSVLQDQELLILELLCQILQTDSLSAIQFWLLYATPMEKDLALGLLQTAVSQLLPQPLASIPAEKLLNQLHKVQEAPQEKQPCQWPGPSMISPAAVSPGPPEYIGKAQVLRLHL
uniref:Thymus, brain and testes associated n=1 Tax=Sciurus vulgaris TaxID=55149 RepID=A0A8D2DJW9_SCIVU